MPSAKYSLVEINSSTKGQIKGVLHLPEPKCNGTAILMVAGAGGGIYGPGGIYFTLASNMVATGTVALQVDYRKANHLENCVQDVLDSIYWLNARHGIEKVVLVGWSFGGAVVITAGAMSPKVIGISTIASQTYGTGLVSKLSPKSLLLFHGTGDSCLSSFCSQSLYSAAQEPKELILLNGDNHGITNNSVLAIEKIQSWAFSLWKEDVERSI